MDGVQALVNALGSAKKQKEYTGSKSGLGGNGFLIKTELDAATNFIKIWLGKDDPTDESQGVQYQNYELYPGVMHTLDVQRVKVTGTVSYVIFDPFNRKQVITAFETYNGTVNGTVKATCDNHGFSDDDTVIISNSENFDGEYVVTKIDDNNFYFTAAWVSTPGETGRVVKKVKA